MNNTDCFSIVFSLQRTCFHQTGKPVPLMTNQQHAHVVVTWRHASRPQPPWSSVTPVTVTDVMVYYQHCRAVPTTDMTYSRALDYLFCVTMTVSLVTLCSQSAVCLVGDFAQGAGTPCKTSDYNALSLTTKTVLVPTINIVKEKESFKITKLNLFLTAHLISNHQPQLK